MQPRHFGDPLEKCIVTTTSSDRLNRFENTLKQIATMLDKQIPNAVIDQANFSV